jgi:hypothetical protein
MAEARRCRSSRLPFPKMTFRARGQDSRGCDEKHARLAKSRFLVAPLLGMTLSDVISQALKDVDFENYCFLKRFSKAWRASSGREGADSAAAAVCVGCE